MHSVYKTACHAVDRHTGAENDYSLFLYLLLIAHLTLYVKPKPFSLSFELCKHPPSLRTAHHSIYLSSVVCLSVCLSNACTLTEQGTFQKLSVLFYGAGT